MSNITAITICDSPFWAAIWQRNVGQYIPTLLAPSDPAHTGGSNKHGHALNHLTQVVKTEYTLIMDCDCLLLGPFECNQNILAAKKTENTMHMCFLAGKTSLLRQFDYSPQGKMLSYPPEKDVGSRLGLLNEDLILVDCKTGDCQRFNAGDIQCDEIWYNGRVIASHFGRGSQLQSKIVRDDRADTQKQLKFWLAGVDK